MGKFKVGDQFIHKNNDKVVTGEILADYGKFYLVMWHHIIGTFYLPAELVEKTYKQVNLEGGQQEDYNNNYSSSYFSFDNPTCPPLHCADKNNEG